ncbi:MAG: AAA family ATPase [Chloroflexi bacterium]|nr:AAA family ATPase [Chloroflexota bacterium]
MDILQEDTRATIKSVVTTGDAEIDNKMGGGVPLGSLTLVEGQSDAGKSVVSQHFTSGALKAGFGVVYYASEDTVKSLIRQLASLGMDVLDYFLADRLRIYPLSFASELKDPEVPSRNLLRHISTLPESFAVVIIDSVTNLVVHSDETKIIDFFSAAKSLCEGGRTLFVVVHSSAFSETMLIRVRSLCDAHFRLHLEQA